MSGNDTNQTDSIKRASVLTGQLSSTLDGIMKAPQTSRHEVLTAHAKDIHEIWDGLFLARRALLRAENSRYQTELESLPKIRNLIQSFIVNGIALNVLIACGLILAYSRGITARLMILSDNAVRFAKRLPLHPRIGGQDEVAGLDQTFHDMTVAIDLANKRQQEFVSIISHDLRTPLAGVMSSVEFFREAYSENVSAEGRHLLERVDRNVEVMLALIAELLDLEKMEAGMLVLDRADVLIADVIAQSVDVIRSLADKRRITIQTPEIEPTTINCDQYRLSRVFVNLLGNALKFSPSGSTITIGLSNTADSVNVTVQDQGRGVPADKIDTLFDRFQQVTAEDSSRGTGLGLAICKAIVEAHGGQIGVQSTVGEGTTFWFRLPVRVDLGEVSQLPKSQVPTADLS